MPGDRIPSASPRAPSFKGYPITKIEVPLEQVTIRRGEIMSVWLRPNQKGTSIQVELHVLEDGTARVLVRKEDRRIVSTFEEVYGP